MSKLTHTAHKPRRCYKCGANIAVGEQYRQYRERATSMHEANHAGRYPVRHECAKCAHPEI